MITHVYSKGLPVIKLINSRTGPIPTGLDIPVVPHEAVAEVSE